VAGVALVIWGLAAEFVPVQILPGPLSVLHELMRSPDYYAVKTLETAVASSAGFVSCVAVCCLIALLGVLFPRTRAALEAAATLTQTIPVVAAAPIIVFALGFGLLTEITIAALISFPPMMAAAMRGFATLPLGARELSRVLGLGIVADAAYIQIPSALIGLGSGLRVSSVLSIVGALIAELMLQNGGLGEVMVGARNHFNSPALFGGLVLSMMLGAGFYALSAYADRAILARVAPSRLSTAGAEQPLGS
jgi:NitT/TauT family transport system permease protein